MKSYASVLFFLAATTSLVAAAPGPLITPAPVLPRQNAAGNDGSKGIAAADLAQEAVDLANAGDIGGLTNAPQFSAIDASASAKEAADVKTAVDVLASAAAATKASNNKGAATAANNGAAAATAKAAQAKGANAAKAKAANAKQN